MKGSRIKVSKPRRRLLLVGTFATLLVGAAALVAQTGGDYELSWWTVDGGGAYSRDGVYGVAGTIGQPDVGISLGGAYSLRGGFWSVFASRDGLFYDGFESGDVSRWSGAVGVQ